MTSRPGIHLTTWPQRKALLHGPSGKPVEATSREPFGYMLRRGPGADMLDGALRDIALGLGVDFRPGERIDHERADVVATGGRHVSGIAPGVVRAR